MAVAGLGFIGYAAIFFVRNFTDSFLELGVGPGEVNVGKDQIQAFSPSLYDYVSHLHIAVSGFIAAAGGGGPVLVRRAPRAGLGMGGGGGHAGAGLGRGPSHSLPERSGHRWPPGADLCRHRPVCGRSRPGASGPGHEAGLMSEAVMVD